jgi:hypothetical protein
MPLFTGITVVAVTSSEWDLSGAFSNPRLHVELPRLAALRGRLHALTLLTPKTTCSPPRRIGAVIDTVTAVLKLAEQPMRARESTPPRKSSSASRSSGRQSRRHWPPTRPAQHPDSNGLATGDIASCSCVERPTRSQTILACNPRCCMRFAGSVEEASRPGTLELGDARAVHTPNVSRGWTSAAPEPPTNTGGFVPDT